jgi:NAD+ synthase (glutamine-hydrolysing)
MRIGIGQLNAHVGAIDANTAKILEMIDQARSSGCDLVVFPELAVCGYSPLDLFWRDGFAAACRAAVDRIAEASEGIGVLVGGLDVEQKHGASNHDNVSSLSDGALIDVYNRAFLFENQVSLGTADKQHLPSYDVYCEERFFTPGAGSSVHAFRGLTLGVNVCEDLWIDDGPTDLQANLGADWILNISASPFYVGKPDIRQRLAARRTKENNVGLVYVNLVGGQDEIVFDGGSFVFDAEGRCIFQAPHFREGLYITDLEHAAPVPERAPSGIEDIRDALVLGIRDYVGKNGFNQVLVGVSGGIDSALVAALAVDALGADNVFCVYMPSEFSADESGEDARAVAANLGTSFETLSIAEAHDALRRAVPRTAAGIVDENLQPRIRGTLLMALANQRGALVLCPGNKSEIAVGYNTLYGDTIGALAPIADLYKGKVYELANAYGDLIPERVRTKPPSAELRPAQRDDDDLPAYEVLDPLLEQALEGNASADQLRKLEVDEAVVKDVVRRIRTSEYKRRQLPPAVKVTPKAFGFGRRLPLTDGYRE